MNLHENRKHFTELIQLAAVQFGILPTYIEKDYWITRSLHRMSENRDAEKVVFKGGTSLSKAYHLTNRFSEDIDVAVIEVDSFSGNQLKVLIKRLAKDMATGMDEVVMQGITSKGSRFYKAIYSYPNLTDLTTSAIKVGQLLIEINTYANPYPYVKQNISSFISDYLTLIQRQDLLEEYRLLPFAINVLDKRQTMVEKIVSLLRFSFSENPTVALAGKIRHFYDLFYLANDIECAEYIKSVSFPKDLFELFIHDQREFNDPKGWQTKIIAESPLMSDFSNLWGGLRSIYRDELRNLAFSNIPNEQLVAESFTTIMRRSII